MTKSKINVDVIADRILWIRRMTASLRDLPLEDREAFLASPHVQAAAESYLRRALEALFDVGRHVLAKKYAWPAREYKEVAKGLAEKRILRKNEAELLRRMAGYRNRMVHFYQEISPEELLEICMEHLSEIESLGARIVRPMKTK
jgi:uncharacterized protein YutE (UPF0331/DUF86 family)